MNSHNKLVQSPVITVYWAVKSFKIIIRCELRKSKKALTQYTFIKHAVVMKF